MTTGSERDLEFFGCGFYAGLLLGMLLLAAVVWTGMGRSYDPG